MGRLAHRRVDWAQEVRLDERVIRQPGPQAQVAARAEPHRPDLVRVDAILRRVAADVPHRGGGVLGGVLAGITDGFAVVVLAEQAVAQDEADNAVLAAPLPDRRAFERREPVVACVPRVSSGETVAAGGGSERAAGAPPPGMMRMAVRLSLALWPGGRYGTIQGSSGFWKR